MFAFINPLVRLGLRPVSSCWHDSFPTPGLPRLLFSPRRWPPCFRPRRIPAVLFCVGLALPWSLASAASFPAVINPQESEEYVFDNLGIKSVLPGAVVVTALQTHDGYLWVGTHEGLARFDGVRFVPFLTTNTPAFLSHSIRCLYEDREGDLWVGTGSGVVRYRRGNFELIGLPNVEVTAIAQDHSGRMWIGTSGLGLNAWQDGKFQRYANEPMLPSTSVRCIEVDSSDRVWAGFENGEGLVCIERGKFH
ncbi:MAG TPA: two-component regulator propeller domain-containing protein, partial [Opitutaceae bacterium]|nr:two-component regulator propeller domain-containing protein [Opitutaceae bacterium]